MENVLLWCHGGCFSGGSINYDEELRTYLEKNKICKVIPVDFCLTNWKTALKDVMSAVEKYDNENLVLGGISSGALLAHIVANCFTLPALLICPVLNPATRHTDLPPELQEKQLKFFHNMSNAYKVENMVNKPNSYRYILFGKHDKRASSETFRPWLNMDKVTCNCLDKGHEICNNPPCELIANHLSTLFTNLH